MSDSCLESEVLLALALRRAGVRAAAKRHLDTCARCRAEVERLREMIRGGLGPATPTPQQGPCLDETAIAAIVDGALTGEPLRQVLAHLGTCERCRRELTGLARLIQEPDIEAAVARVEPGRGTGRRWLVAGGTLGLAAAALLAITLIPRDPPPTALHRDSVPAGDSAAAAVEPLGPVGAVTAFRWEPVPDADRYEVLLFAADGTVLWESRTVETFVVPPDSVRLEHGQSYFWQVRARVGYEQWSESSLHSFRMRVP